MATLPDEWPGTILYVPDHPSILSRLTYIVDGQAAWFTHYHPEKVQSGLDRYRDQTERVVAVVDMYLKENNKQWLVGDKCTYADLSFVTWDMAIPFVMGDDKRDLGAKYPAWKKWHEAMLARDSLKKIQADKQAAAKNH